MTRRRPLAGVIGALAVTVVAVSGCAAGQEAQTVEQTSVVDGTAFQAGNVDLRDVGLAAPTAPSYAKGSNAFLEGLVVNKAVGQDQLVSVSSPLATSVLVFDNQADALLGVAPTASETPLATDSASPTDSSSPTDSTSPTDGSTPTDSTSPSASTSTSSSAAAPSALTTVPLPANQSVLFGYGADQLAIVFVGLTQEIFPAQTFPVTFTFANAGAVTATVAVKLPVGRSLDAPSEDTEPSE